MPSDFLLRPISFDSIFYFSRMCLSTFSSQIQLNYPQISCDAFCSAGADNTCRVLPEGVGAQIDWFLPAKSLEQLEEGQAWGWRLFPATMGPPQFWPRPEASLLPQTLRCPHLSGILQAALLRGSFLSASHCPH